MDKKITLGVSGLGRNFPRQHSRSVPDSFLVKYCYDPSVILREDSQSEIGRRMMYRASSFTNLLSRLADKQGALVVNSPDNIHYYQTLGALAFGVPVFCEKPMAVTKEHCEIIRAAVAKTKLPYICGLVAVEFAHLKHLKELFQQRFGGSDLTGWTVEAGYYHDLLPLFKEWHAVGSDFHLLQNSHLGGGIHPFSAILSIMGTRAKGAEGVEYRGKLSEVFPELPSENPLVYRGEIQLLNGAKLILETDVVPQKNTFGHENQKQRQDAQVYIAIRDNQGKLIAETRGNKSKNLLYFCGEDVTPPQDMLAFTRLYEAWGSAIREGRQPEVNNADFAYNCTVPLIESLEKAKAPRTDLS